MVSELKKLWNKEKQLRLKVQVRTGIIDDILLPSRLLRIKRLDKQINNFNRNKDEYHWKEYFDSLVN